MAVESAATSINVHERPATAKILVVDDERALRQTIMTVLEYAGYAVTGASDGLAGARVAEDYQPDLIISDIVMPNLDGYGLLKNLRENPKTATIPIIFVTALSEHFAMRQVMALGADDYLVKPFQPGELLKAVQTRLQRQAILAEKHDTTLNMLRRNIIYALPHEMRTPLHLILGFAQILEMHHEHASREEILQATGAIIKAGQRLERLIENYLAYAQMEVIAQDANEVKTLRDHVTVDVDLVIRDTAQQQAAANNRAADLLVDTTPTTLNMAQESIVKMVTELVDNACKFSSSGTPIWVNSTIENGAYVLTVGDLGRGMTTEDTRRIGAYMQFQRAFYEQQGLGFGLAVVSRLAELHGGYIEIESAPEAGTQIHVHLPQ
ncbi:MAG: response regulator [Anaerolineae bacterium]|nr:response regulator [Anaerolineae bacterium]